MPFNPARALEDIRYHIVLAHLWTGNVTLEQFTENQAIFYAVTRCLEIISEATRKLPQEMLDRHPEIAWHAIKASGNIYRHRYDDVLERDVFNSVKDHLPALAAVVAIEQGKTP